MFKNVFFVALMVVGALVIIGTCSRITRSVFRDDDEAPTVDRESDARATPKTENVCVVRIRNSPDSPVPGFPTSEGLDEYSSAAAQGLNDRGMLTVLLANNGKLIDPGTECVFTDVGLFETRARILSGPFAGQSFFFPTEWTIEKREVQDDK